MKPLHRGFQQCIDFEHSVSIIVVAVYIVLGGNFWVRYNLLSVHIVEIQRRRPISSRCTTQATRPKWLIMKPLHNWFQRCFDSWHSVSIRVVAEVRDAWFWLFWHQYNIYEFLCSTRPKIPSLYRWILIISLWANPDILSTVCFNTQPHLWHVLIKNLVSMTIRTINTWRKLIISAFQWAMGWGVADRVFISKNAMACTP
jgi:hypothetical protein